MTHVGDARPGADRPGPVLLFDGVCHLCHATVRWVAARDRQAQFRFASLDSPVAHRLLRAARAEAPSEAGVVLVEGDRAWLRSDAVLEVMRRLGAPWSALGVARVLPWAWREALYRYVARRRYGWFGRYEACPLPPPELRARFLDVAAVNAGAAGSGPPEAG